MLSPCDHALICEQCAVVVEEKILTPEIYEHGRINSEPEDIMVAVIENVFTSALTKDQIATGAHLLCVRTTTQQHY
jgi:hypothetical protein